MNRALKGRGFSRAA